MPRYFYRKMGERMSKKNSNRKNRPNKKEAEQEMLPLISLIMLVAPFLVGLSENYFMLFSLSLVTICLFGILLVNRRIKYYRNISVYAGLGILLLSFFSIFYGISSGDAVIGFLRILFMAIYCLLFMQYEKEQRMEVLEMVPTAGTCMTVLSAILVFFPGTRDFVISHTSRFQGFFQYANIYAFFLLLGMVIYLKETTLPAATGKGKRLEAVDRGERWKYCIEPVILLVGIVASGSRFTIVLTVFTLLYLGIVEKRGKAPYLIVLGLIISGGYVLLTGSTRGFGRIFSIFRNSSTLMGRFLYWEDALSMILKRPWGMGYYGFFYLQQVEQTGVYTTKFVHNDWLQTALDYGVIALILLVVLFVIGIKNSRGTRRLVLCLIAIHMVFDFDLQYMVIAWIMLLCMDFTAGECRVLELRSAVLGGSRGDGARGDAGFRGAGLVVVSGCAAVIFLLGAWIGTADVLRKAGQYELSNAIYPWEMETEEYAMVLSEDPEVICAHASHILKEFDQAGVCYDALALVDESRGDYLEMIKNKRLAVQYQKYSMDRYDEYIAMLDEAATKFESDGDTENYEICVSYMEEVVERLESLEEETNPLTYQTVDAPDFQLNEISIIILEKYGVAEGTGE